MAPLGGDHKAPRAMRRDLGKGAVNLFLVSRGTDEARRQEILARAALTLASELSLPVVLQKIVELACEVADARYGALGVLGAAARTSRERLNLKSRVLERLALSD